MSIWMDAAIKEASLAASEAEVPVGAVLVKDGEIICSAHDLREASGDPTAHAEMLCLREGAKKLGGWRLKDCTLYVTLEPCPMCAGAILMSHLKHCVWGAADPRQGCCGSVYDLPADPSLHGTTTWSAGDQAQECGQLLTDFFRRQRVLKGNPQDAG